MEKYLSGLLLVLRGSPDTSAVSHPHPLVCVPHTGIDQSMACQVVKRTEELAQAN